MYTEYSRGTSAQRTGLTFILFPASSVTGLDAARKVLHQAILSLDDKAHDGLSRDIWF